MAALQESVHIIPLGHEYDRAVAPFRKRSADRVYILTVSEKTGDYSNEMIKRQNHFTNKVIDFFKGKNTEVVIREVQLFDLLEVMKEISAIITAEQVKGNRVHVNMSACGRKTSIGAALAGMVHKVDVYYVNAESYALNKEDCKEHGLSICDSGGTFRFENFEFTLPDEISQKILVKLFLEGRGVPSTEIRDFLNDNTVEGFEIRLVDIAKAQKTIEIDNKLVNKRDITIAQNIRLEKKYLGNLETSGYIKRKRSGRRNIITITESGKYIACISGQLHSSVDINRN